MASKQGYGADLRKYMDKRLDIKINGNRRIIGKLRGYDQFMNLVLDDCQEVINKKNVNYEEDLTIDKYEKNKEENSNLQDDTGEQQKRVPIGQVLLRGNSVIFWECLDKI